MTTTDDSTITPWRPQSQEDMAPAQPIRRAEANIAALRVLRDRPLDADGYPIPLTDPERQVVGRWGGWGACPHMFDDEPHPDWAHLATELRDLLTPEEWEQASASTLNAHYTDHAVAEAMWSIAEQLGFKGGMVLEPGCGIGTFMATVPEHLDVRMTGVEADVTTARLAQVLWPDANIIPRPFEKALLGVNEFDLVIGNVPFHDSKPFDPVWNKAGHSLHNYAILWSLARVRPGGLMVLLTSRYTMDSRRGKHRAAIAQVADLVGAVRLPGGTMQRAAGTRAIMDLLVFRKRLPGESPAEGRSWLAVDRLYLPREDKTRGEYGQGATQMNEWFLHLPDEKLRHAEPTLRLGRILGVPMNGRGMYGDNELVVVAQQGTTVEYTASQAVHYILAQAEGSGLTWAADWTSSGLERHEVEHWGETLDRRKPGSIHATAEDTFVRIEGGKAIPYEGIKGKAVREAILFLGLRDQVLALLEAEASEADDATIDRHRAELGRLYDMYAERYGPLNRCTFHERQAKGSDDVTISRRRPQVMYRLRPDPDYHLVLSLEDFDDETQEATKAAIFTQRTVVPRKPRTSADTPADAIDICLDRLGYLDVPTVAQLLDRSEDDTLDALVAEDLAYQDPSTMSWVTATEYASGDVRAKLAAAKAAAEVDGRFDRNVPVLEAIVPTWLGPNQIDGRPGAPWVPESDVEAFIAEVLGIEVVISRSGGKWEVEVDKWKRGSAKARSFGTDRIDALDLFRLALNQTAPRIVDETPDGGKVTNKAETLLAINKQADLGQRFAEWLWEDDERTERLCEVYNLAWNSHVEANYTGEHLTFPGMAETWRKKIRPHQRAGIHRSLVEGGTFLDWFVGAGKTLGAVALAMEMRRLGLANKPCAVVPNHITEQWATEVRAIYPTARVLLYGEDDRGAEGRAAFVSRCALGDWDLVVMSVPAFTALGMPPSVYEEVIGNELVGLRAELWGADAKRTKAVEGQIARTKARLDRQIDVEGKDQGSVNWAMTGIDALIIDEAKEFKNLDEASMSDRQPRATKRPKDLAIKADWMNLRYGSRGSRFRSVVWCLDGTPVANTLAELWVMSRFVNKQRLAESGLGSFDEWKGMFASQVSRLEVSPTGEGWQMRTRWAKYRNVPELQTWWRTAAYVVDRETAAIPGIPTMAGDARQVVTIAPSTGLLRYVGELVAWAEMKPAEMLQVCTAGRKAALDLRLVGRNPDPAGGKARAVATQMARIYHEHKGDRFEGSDIPGALQLGFCDLGVPHPGNPSVYGHITRELVQRGVPRKAIRWMQEANNATAKARLFREAREGKVAILLGSTLRMGTGTNVQNRCIALHHIDAPWRPCDIEQREGRALRQGNTYAEVGIYAYVTEGSFDAYMWQLIEAKARFIAQVRAKGSIARVVDEITDSDSLSFAEIKAAAAGNQLAAERATAEGRVAELRILRAGHLRQMSGMRRESEAHASIAERAHKTATDCRSAIRWRDMDRARHGSLGPIQVQFQSNRWTPNYDGLQIDYLVEAIKGWSDREYEAQKKETVGRYGMFEVYLQPAGRRGWVTLTLSYLPGELGIQINIPDQRRAAKIDWEAELSDMLDRLEEVAAKAAHQIEHHEARAVEFAEMAKTPWEREPELVRAEAALAVLEAQITELLADTTKNEVEYEDNPTIPDDDLTAFDLTAEEVEVVAEAEGIVATAAENLEPPPLFTEDAPGPATGYVTKRSKTSVTEFQLFDADEVAPVTPPVKPTRMRLRRKRNILDELGITSLFGDDQPAHHLNRAQRRKMNRGRPRIARG